MKGNPVVHFEIYAQDIERAKKFYESTFAVTLEKNSITHTGDGNVVIPNGR